MANIKFRTSNDVLNIPGSSTVKGTPLTNLELDGNFKSVQVDLDLKAPLASPTFTGSVTIPGGTINGTAIGGTTKAAGGFTTLTATGATTLTAGTASTSTTTGTLVVTGGVGVSGRVTADDVRSVTNVISGTTASTTTGTGALVVAGGVGANGQVTSLALAVSNNATIGGSVTAGSLSVSGASTLTGAVTSSGIVTGTQLKASAGYLQINTSGTASQNFFFSAATAGVLTLSRGNIGAGTADLISWDTSGLPTLPQTSALVIPKGTTAQRPTAATGMLRYNSTTNEFEGYANTSWGPLGGGGFAAVTVLSADATAATRNLYVFGAGALTLTLPIAPNVGDYIGVSNMSGLGTNVIARNGKPIVGVAENMTVDMTTVGITLIFTGDVYGWIIL